MFGEFLYYSAWISRRELNDAVEWQRASRPKFGELAIELGLLTERQLLALLRQTPGRVPLGKRAVARRAITDAQREGVLAAQRKLQRPIGCYFVESAILLSTDVRRLAQRQVEHNQRVRTAA